MSLHPDVTPVESAANGVIILKAYRTATGGDQGQTPTEVLFDLLVDLAHLADACGIIPARLFADALNEAVAECRSAGAPILAV